MLWIKRHYCPYVAQELSQANIAAALSNLKARAKQSDHEYTLSVMVGLMPAHLMVSNRPERCQKTILGHDIAFGEVLMKFNIVDFPMEETYLLPYLFRVAMVREQMYLTVVSEHWSKMESIDILPKGSYDIHKGFLASKAIPRIMLRG